MSTNNPQRLPTMTLTTCQNCGNRVYFRARSSVPSSDPLFKVEYLICPACGASATRLKEIEILAKPLPLKHRVKHIYRA